MLLAGATSLFVSLPVKYIHGHPTRRPGNQPASHFSFQQREKKGKKFKFMRASFNLVLLALAQHITELLQRAPDELGVLPEVGGEEAVGVDDGDEGGLEGVLEGLGGTGRGGVGVLDTGKLEETLDGGGGNKAGTAGGGDELDSY